MRKRCFQTSWLAVMRWSEIWCHLTSFDVDIVFSYMSKAYKLHFSVKCCVSLWCFLYFARGLPSLSCACLLGAYRQDAGWLVKQETIMAAAKLENIDQSGVYLKSKQADLVQVMAGVSRLCSESGWLIVIILYSIIILFSWRPQLLPLPRSCVRKQIVILMN